MKSHTSLQCFLTVFTLWIGNIGYNAQTLRLDEGEICHSGYNSTYNSICKNINECSAMITQMKAKNYSVKICSFIGKNPIVCCPPNKTENNKKAIDTYSAKEMCTQYSDLINRLIPGPTLSISKIYQISKLITNGRKAQPKEFPHMVLLNYHEIPNYKSFSRCGGSLISKNFVLTAAHCEKSGHKDSLKYATWARLGELDYLLDTDDAKPMNYRIVERIIHPLYMLDTHYHDIALFRLEKDVEFSAYIRPICLNTDNSFNPPKVIATGWGKTGESDGHSSHLLKATIEMNPTKECDEDFTTIKKKLPRVDDELMMCSVVNSGKDTCQGDSGGPIQVAHENYTSMYSQIGITSFGSIACGVDKESSVYTRVSYYISWIEEIVWPKIDQKN